MKRSQKQMLKEASSGLDFSKAAICLLSKLSHRNRAELLLIRTSKLSDLIAAQKTNKLSLMLRGGVHGTFRLFAHKVKKKVKFDLLP